MQPCKAGLAVGRLWEAGPTETCLCIALEEGVWVTTDILHEGCAGRAMCYFGAVQERTCFVTFIRTYFLPIINAWFYCAVPGDLCRNKTKEPIHNYECLKYK